MSFNTGTKIRKNNPGTITGGEDSATTSTEPSDTPKPDTTVKPIVPPKIEDVPKPVISNPPPRKPEPPAEKPKSEGEKRKGKKGDGEN